MTCPVTATDRAREIALAVADDQAICVLIPATGEYRESSFSLRERRFLVDHHAGSSLFPVLDAIGELSRHDLAGEFFPDERLPIGLDPEQAK